MPAVPAQTPGEFLKNRREELGLSLRQAAKDSGVVSHTHIRELEMGIYNLDNSSLATIMGLARAYRLSLSELLMVLRGDNLFQSPRVSTDTTAAPVRAVYLPEVEAGAGLPNWDDERKLVKTFLPRERFYDNLDERELFRVRIKGDSMAPTLQNRQVVVFRSVSAAETGDVVAVHVPEDGLIVKRLHKTIANPNESDCPLLVLASDNTAYPISLAPEGARIRGVKVFSMSEGSR